MDAFLKNEHLHLISLLDVEGVGDKIARTLISHCGSAEAVFKERKQVLAKLPEVSSAVATNVKRYNNFDQAERELLFIEKNKIKIFSFYQPDYPFRLKQCHDCPLLLYFKGDANLSAQRMVAIVGTRNATPYGVKVTKDMVAGLAGMNVTIVSGLAYGIDITAHKAATAYNIPNIGILAHGLDKIYPAVHRQIAANMIQNGGLLTEKISGSSPDRENFPRRNRIIAGLCDAVIVVEAATKGGALITAEIANSYNRDVFAVPGKTDDLYSEGCNRLIKSHKAALITGAEDIRYIMRWEDGKRSPPIVQRKLFVDLSAEAAAMLEYISKAGKVHIDQIYFGVNKTVSQVAAVLLELEMKGVIRVLPGKTYEVID